MSFRRSRLGFYLKADVLVVVKNWLSGKKNQGATELKKSLAIAAGFLFMILQPRNIAAPCWKRFDPGMKKLSILFFLLILIVCLGVFWFKKAASPAGKEAIFQDFLIAKGSSASAIGNKLKKANFIKSSLAFKIYIQVTGRAGKIQAGEYRLSPHYSLFKVAGELLKGPLGVWVTIPEGFRREEIAQRFAESLEKDDPATFVKEFLQASAGLEGYLFPDTYIFLKNISANVIVQKMETTFAKKVGEQIGKEQLIVASLVERETKTEAERPVVAGIIYKRLKNNWPLQIDASVQYAAAGTKCTVQSTECKWWGELTKEDLMIKSPYNTYQYPGLPPAPIANPGLSSLEAAINPKDSDYWFYLHDQNGKIHYAETVDKHNENIRRYLSK